MASQYEIEIKVLLGSFTEKDRLLSNLQSNGNTLVLKGQNSQLNHYFIGGDIAKLEKLISDGIPEDKKASFHHIVKDGKKLSVRTRYVDGKTILVIKASIDDTTSSNGTARIEWEMDFLSTHIDVVDQILLDAGFEYQAKWSRERDEYSYGDTTVCIDRNAGYGYLAEFERVIEDASEIETIK
jgi:predicted adenylyl cyclase CyaB